MKTLRFNFIYLILIFLFLLFGFNSNQVYAKAMKKNPRYVYSLPYFKHKTLKLVEQLTQGPKRWPMALKSLKMAAHVYAKNHIKYSIIVVAYGPGLKAFVMTYDAKYAKLLKKLNKEGVQMVVCHHAMKEAKVTTAMLYPFVKVAYPEIIEYIVKKEDQGYAFIKP